MTQKQNYIDQQCIICLKVYHETVYVLKAGRNHQRYCAKRGHKLTGKSNDLHLIKELKGKIH